MLKLHSVAQVPVIPSGKIGIHLNTGGILFGKDYLGAEVCAEAGSVGLSGLNDVTGTFGVGHAPAFDGTVFRPAAAGGSTPTLTIVSSGLVEVVAVLASGVIPDGSSPATFTWSGIDQSYDSLEIRGVARGQTSTQNTVGVAVYFNGDTTNTNYWVRRMISTADSSLTHTSFNTSYCAQIQSLLDDDVNSVSISPFHIMIPNYAQAGFRKNVYTVGIGASYNTNTAHTVPATFAMQWINTIPVNMIEVKVADGTNTFCSGTAIYLLGHKKIWAVTSGIFGTAGVNNGRFV